MACGFDGWVQVFCDDITPLNDVNFAVQDLDGHIDELNTWP